MMGSGHGNRSPWLRERLRCVGLLESIYKCGQVFYCWRNVPPGRYASLTQFTWNDLPLFIGVWILDREQAFRQAPAMLRSGLLAQHVA